MNEGIAAVIAALVAAFVAYLVSNRDLSDSLDTKSGWRQKLFEVASTYELNLDHAQTVRAALRFLPQDEAVEEYSFAWFSNIMIMHLDGYILKKEYQVEQRGEKLGTLTDFNTKIVHHFAMFLLKYHYENRNSMGPKNYLFIADKNKNTRYNPIVAEACYEYIKLIKEELKMTKKDKGPQEDKGKTSCSYLMDKLFWLVSLSLLFILIIVVGLFEKEVVSNLLWVLYLLLFTIAFLSGCIVYQKDKKEKEEKEQHMSAMIGNQKWYLKKIYENLKKREENH